MRFCFYLGYRDLKGGYTTLLLTLIRELINQKQEVVLINFAQGLIANELKKEKITINIIDLDTLDWNKIDQKIYPTDIFIIPKFLEIYWHLLKINPRIIYFDINDFICKISDYKFGIRLPYLGKKLVKKLLIKKSLIFMDDTGVFNLKKYFNIDIKDPVFLPIPVSVPDKNAYLNHQREWDKTRNLTYIGRSVDWKMMPLKKILEDCNKANFNNRINISIIVDNKENFKKFINLNNYSNNPNLTINVFENFSPSLLNDFLLKTSDLHFAMGTAALDAAKLGIPTILLDYSTKSFAENYSYKWLHETKNYSLGRNLEKRKENKGGVSIHELSMSQIINKEKITNFSTQCYEYTLNNHSVDKIVKRLLSICVESDFRLADAHYLIPYYFEAHIFFKKVSSFFKKRKIK